MPAAIESKPTPRRRIFEPVGLVPTCFKLPPADLERLKEDARRNGTTMGAEIRAALAAKWANGNGHRQNGSGVT